MENFKLQVHTCQQIWFKNYNIGCIIYSLISNPQWSWQNSVNCSIFYLYRKNKSHPDISFFFEVLEYKSVYTKYGKYEQKKFVNPGRESPPEFLNMQSELVCVNITSMAYKNNMPVTLINNCEHVNGTCIIYEQWLNVTAINVCFVLYNYAQNIDIVN